MARLRLGVVVLVPGRLAVEIDGLRRACGDDALGRVPPHITLVPPVNVATSRLSEALQRLRHAATVVEPFELTLGPVTSFAPDSPTLYLAVGGEDDEVTALHRLRDAVFEAPLHRELAWPFVPHVTIADDSSSDRMEAAVLALADYRARVAVGAVHLLQEERETTGPRWRSIADYRLGGPVHVARGGLPLELWCSDGPDAEALALLDGAEQPRPDPTAQTLVVVVARRRDETVGVLWGLADGSDQVGAVVVAPEHRTQGIARHLHARFVAEAGASGQLRRHT